MQADNITKLSNKLLIVFCFFFAMVIVVDSALWLVTTVFHVTWVNASFPIEGVVLPLTPERALLGYIPMMLPGFLTMAMLWQLIRLFSLYKNHQIFTPSNTACYRRLSYLLMATPVIELLSDISLSFVLSYEQGNWKIGYKLTDSDFTMLIIGIIVFAIAKVMTQAVTLQQENELTI